MASFAEHSFIKPGSWLSNEWAGCLWSPWGFSVQLRRKQFWATGSVRYFKPGAEHRVICFGRHFFFFFYLASIFGGRISVFQQYRGTSLQFSRDEVLWLRWWGASRQSSCTDLFLEGWVSLDHEPLLSPLSPRDCPQRCRGFPHISLDAEFYSCFCELLTPSQGWKMDPCPMLLSLSAHLVEFLVLLTYLSIHLWAPCSPGTVFHLYLCLCLPGVFPAS